MICVRKSEGLKTKNNREEIATFRDEIRLLVLFMYILVLVPCLSLYEPSSADNHRFLL